MDPDRAWPMLLQPEGEAGLVAFARALGQTLVHAPVPCAIVLLRGAMGAGKTTWTRGFAAGLGVVRPERVCSPTFTLAREHPGTRTLLHVDLCRMGELGDDPTAAVAAFESLGLDELAARAGQGAAVLVVEWSELWPDAPAAALTLALARVAGDPDARTIACSGPAPWPERVAAAWAAARARPPGPDAG
ncbi:MAG: tRNA (adenosine(37)-N6)-threonylcarbamoyltransferase complex ATPase subunit type 1 TsaE [Nannocystaceae bacterium]|nr:tRNA (adenosine(37)-N6)-threonylcarbamoyltransferase complex ATPase subunit type 1 TsaE [Nannocystaceae bacterium]